MANNLVLTSATFDSTTQKFGGGALSGGYGVAAAGLIGSRPFAIGIWFKIAANPTATQVIIGQNQLFWIGFNANGTLHFEYGGYNGTTSVTVNTASPLTAGVWHFATLSISSTSTMTATLDGAVVGATNAAATQAAFASATDAAGHATGYLAIRTHGGYESAYLFAGEVDETSIWQADQFNTAFSVPTAPYTGSEPNLLALWHLDSNGADSLTTSSVSVPPNNTSLIYSPGNWLVSSSSAKTINAGAYLRTLFTGASCTLTFDVSVNSTPLPELFYRIDGLAWTQVTLASSIALTMPVTSAAWPHHYLEVFVRSTSEYLNYGSSQGGSRWSPQNAAVVFTGMTLSAGQSVSAPTKLGQTVWVYGDSITEGFHTVTSAGSGAQDTLGSDALLGWAYRQRELLGAEIGVIGFGGAGISVSGALGVPNLPNSYNLLWASQARVFSPAPDLIVINYGENDGSSTGDTTFIANYRAVLSGLLAATPATTKIACMVPFSQKKAADIATCVTQAGNPRVSLVVTTGMFASTDSVDGQHPLGVANLGVIGPALANKLRPLLQGIRYRWVRA